MVNVDFIALLAIQVLYAIASLALISVGLAMFASYFVSRTTIIVTDQEGMARWRKRLFAVIARNAATPVGYFKLPDDRTVVMGAHIEL